MQLLNQHDPVLSTEEKARILAIITDGMPIASHSELLSWLQGGLQQFLPHDVLISAWGDFTAWRLRLDVISPLPGARTEWIARCENFTRCRINSALNLLFLRWGDNGRRPFVVSAKELLSIRKCTCPLIEAVQPMRTILVHGMHDERGTFDSLYMLLSWKPPRHSEQRTLRIADFLIPQVDIALRRVASLPNAETTSVKRPNGESVGLTTREREIVDWICRGKINSEIGAALNISTFTVKNHLRRIFKKLGAANRADAVVKYQQARH
jgi:transcriptional regulator EpsA